MTQEEFEEYLCLGDMGWGAYDEDDVIAALPRLDLRIVRDDVVLLARTAWTEAPGLLKTLEAGRIDGSCYSGACCCLVGTIAKVRRSDVWYMKDFPIDMCHYRPAECWAGLLSIGDCPSNSFVAARTAEWIREAIALGPIPVAT